ncbi:hypothetical protein EDD18DRAFT_1146174 [Armillaria luteobubalina]|uniref:Uncharacterized protein n=1 Tax=Armillaria luteobubalina TaxID=153913 RepID=A0AA39UWQ6_9AGAR|nr:hypothetical protein EDD18DRAFT_1146174 [Armillaria luteobubalina]
MSTLPQELVELIIYDIWHSEMPSWTRQSFLTTWPLINRTWKYAHARIISRDIYITSRRYLYYLCDVACRRKSIIYDDLVPRLTHTINCFVDLEERGYTLDNAALRVHNLLKQLPNFIGFSTLFPLAEYISFGLTWIGGLRFPDDTEVHDLPLHLDRRYLLKTAYENEVQMDTYVCITDPKSSSALYGKIRSSTSLLALGDNCNFYVQLIHWERPYDIDVEGGSLQLHQTLDLYQVKGDIRGVNQYLWMAAQRDHGIFNHLARPYYYWKYYQLQQSLPAV